VLGILENAGFDIGNPKPVKIPRDLIAAALDSAPNEIKIFDKNGKPAMTLKKGACPTHLDLHTGTRRTTTKKKAIISSNSLQVAENTQKPWTRAMIPP
jgi:trimethylamine:corrinoid methyltransferase-like protein